MAAEQPAAIIVKLLLFPNTLNFLLHVFMFMNYPLSPSRLQIIQFFFSLFHLNYLINTIYLLLCP